MKRFNFKPSSTLFACAVFVLTPAIASASTWVATQERNVPDAYSYTRLTVSADNLANSKASTSRARPVLAVNCIPDSSGGKGEFLTASLSTGRALKVSWVEPMEIHGLNYLPMIAVRYSTANGQREERDNWKPGADDASVRVPRSALEEMIHARSVEISASDEHGSPLLLHFDMPDATPVVQACNL